MPRALEIVSTAARDQPTQSIAAAAVLPPLTGPSIAPVQPQPEPSNDPGEISGLSPTCPLCHTVEQTMTWDGLRRGETWLCARCGQTWSARRLETAAAYVKYA